MSLVGQDRRTVAFSSRHSRSLSTLARHRRVSASPRWVRQLACTRRRVDSHILQSGVAWRMASQVDLRLGSEFPVLTCAGVWECMIGVARRIINSMLLHETTRFSREVVCTLVAEVSAIMNARPLVPVSADTDSPFILTPAMLLTQKIGAPPPGDFNDNDIFRSQWRQVQILANKFWTRWRSKYLPTLQNRRKWNTTHRNIRVDDIVLVKDSKKRQGTCGLWDSLLTPSPAEMAGWTVW